MKCKHYNMHCAGIPCPKNTDAYCNIIKPKPKIKKRLCTISDTPEWCNANKHHCERRKTHLCHYLEPKPKKFKSRNPKPPKVKRIKAWAWKDGRIILSVSGSRRSSKKEVPCTMLFEHSNWKKLGGQHE